MPIIMLISDDENLKDKVIETINNILAKTFDTKLAESRNLYIITDGKTPDELKCITDVNKIIIYLVNSSSQEIPANNYNSAYTLCMSDELHWKKSLRRILTQNNIEVTPVEDAHKNFTHDNIEVAPVRDPLDRVINKSLEYMVITVLGFILIMAVEFALSRATSK